MENQQYKEIVKVEYIKSIKKLINTNINLTITQKDILNEYRDDLETKLPMNFNDESGKLVKLKSLRSYQSIRIYLEKVIKFVIFTKKEIKYITKEDIRKYRLSLKNNTINERNNYNSKTNDRTMSNTTIEFYFTLIKRFFIWFYNKDEGTTILPNLVKNFNREKIYREKLNQSELLTPNEIKQMIEVCTKPRDKALISLLFESGGRVGEIVGLNISSFEDKGNYGKIRLEGKTGIRNLVITDSIYYIRKLINEHPFKDNLESPLFLSHYKDKINQRLTKSGISSILKRTAKDINLKKKHNPHWFRHSQLDLLFRTAGINEHDLRIFAGWTKTSNMMEIYIHYDEDGVNEKILKSKGKTLELKSENDKLLQNKICNKCRELFPNDNSKWEHPATARYCTCGMVLDKSEILKIDKLKKDESNFIKELMKHPMISNSNGDIGDALFQSMINNPSLMEKFKGVLKENDL